MVCWILPKAPGPVLIHAFCLTHFYPCLPHTEPTDDWTVGEVFQWTLLQSYKATDDKYELLQRALHQQLDAAEQDIWNVHRQVLHEAEVQADETDPNAAAAATDAVKNAENEAPVESSYQVSATGKSNAAATATANAASSKQSSKSKNATTTATNLVHVEIVGGMYVGETFDLKPKLRAPCMVGRSQGKRFKDRGISLSQDLEVSTTHGKFEVLNGLFYFTDTGSTNGSKVAGEELEPDIPYPLTHGLVLTCGQTAMKISLSL